jgi:hypothetical protein
MYFGTWGISEVLCWIEADNLHISRVFKYEGHHSGANQYRGKPLVTGE